MKNKIYAQAKEDFEDYKEALMRDGIKDYQFYSLALMYELTEYFEQMDDELAEVLSKYEHPLDEVYNRWMKYDDNLWNRFGDVINDMKGDK